MAPAFGPGRDPGDPGSNPTSGSRCMETEREREAETQAGGEAGFMHREPDVGFDPGSPGSRPEPKAGAKPLRHPGIPYSRFLNGSLTLRIKFKVFNIVYNSL